MMFSRRARTTALSCALSGVLLQGVGLPAAWAYDVVPDADAAVCRVDPRQKDSAVSQFWTQLRQDAVAQRLDEMDAADPGLKQAIEDYDLDRPGASLPGELQERIAATGTSEGLGMFIPHRTQAEDGIGDQAGDKTTYTPTEARAAARAIGDHPANAPQDALDTQARTSHLRLDEITADIFRQRHAEYEGTQFALRDALNSCADEVEDATRPALWQTPQGMLLIGGIVVALGVLARVVYNVRRPSRHARRS
ncbi:hypothetical protein C1Y63_06540 [Corynebacterium sp. 13CS0277]|uniref:hypothetical protein n=1 Tax=Corynebacterium sp. 13CS0277 TaxID=2071994 RepID=UPI000D034E59|nr:hypothetical protein [Corynebacterium sp. 13CS0277]PRQ11361.1 hypothetical protein C1Y63_06540 [Corynebacterium sp. 13CS0277]